MKCTTFQLLIAAVALTTGLACDSRPPAASTPPAEASTAATPASLAAYAGSAVCVECHAEQHDEWKHSHHALAQRPLNARMDDPAFHPPREIRHGSQTSRAALAPGATTQPATDDDLVGRYVLTTLGAAGMQDFTPTGALGVAPLWQYLIPAPGGRLQLTELAWDPLRTEWFNVYGDEDRLPHEWGHWSNRGMNWNSMCATCHTTAFQKNYRAADDTYASEYRELGVGCESCHGPSKLHADWQRANRGRSGDPHRVRLNWDGYFQACMSCHSRRSDLTGAFAAGQYFSDHYRLILPDLTDTFWPDGQVHDEDFEGAPYSLSYMHAAGIRCIDCHSAHGGKVLARDNSLCARCHDQGIGVKMPIDPATHTFHQAGTPGSFCVDCHMPQTTYMQRHARRDHGMTIPDPVLTKEHGIPNACNRCHTDRDVNWAIGHVEQWYGSRMERPTRARTRLLARVKASDLTAIPDLLDVLAGEKNPAWRGVIANFLVAAVQAPLDPALHARVVEALSRQLDDASPIAQTAAIEALEPELDHAAEGSALRERLHKLLEAPRRVVRVSAAWALRRELAPGSRAHQDLLASLDFNADQPLGAMRYAQYFTDIGRIETALPWFEKAVRWDPNAAAFRHAYATALDMAGRPDDAIQQAARALELEPQEAAHAYALGLLYAEVGRYAEARDALRSAVTLRPEVARYWYNLALAESRAGNAAGALDAIAQAERLEPANADLPYTRATIEYGAGNHDAARQAAEQALRIDPTHTGARALIEHIK